LQAPINDEQATVSARTTGVIRIRAAIPAPSGRGQPSGEACSRL
jgi:hypothetical protein